MSLPLSANSTKDLQPIGGDHPGICSGINKRNIAIAIGVVAIISLIAVALVYAEVKWSALSRALSWTLTHPVVLGAVATLLVLCGIAYVVYRYLQSSCHKINENNRVPPALTLYPLEELERVLALAYTSYRQEREVYNGLIAQGENEDSWALVSARTDLIRAQLNLLNAVDALTSGNNSGGRSPRAFIEILNRYPYNFYEFIADRN